MNYGVDLSGDAPQAVLNITYEHTCRAKDWMTTDYRDWLRVYAPTGSNLEEADGQTGDAELSEELGKKVFGMRVDVPIGETKTITLKYQLPQSVKNNDYHLLIQKQSGSGDLPDEHFREKSGWQRNQRTRDFDGGQGIWVLSGLDKFSILVYTGTLKPAKAEYAE